MKNSRRAITLLLATATCSGAAVIHFNSQYTGTVQDGSITAPWKTLDKCFTTASPGDICLLEPGDYNLATPSGGTIGRVTRNGTAAAPIRIEARLAGSTFIGAWHDITWRRSTSWPTIWESRLNTTLAGTIRALQNQTAGVLNQSGVRLLYMSRHVLPRHATWPRTPDLFPRMGRIDPGSDPVIYRIRTLPQGELDNAKFHVFRDEEQGAVVRNVSRRIDELQVSISDGQIYDEMSNRGGTRRFWISDHPTILDPEQDQGLWTYKQQGQSIHMASGIDPNTIDLAMQISAVGPDLSGRSHWVFKGVTFFGVVPITDAASSNLRFESVTFYGLGLSQGMPDFTSTQADLTGLVLRGDGHVVDRSDFLVCPNSCVEILGSGITVKNSTFGYSQLNGGAYSGTIHVMGPNALVRDNRLEELGVSGISIAPAGTNARVSNNYIDNWGRLAYSRAGGVVAYGKGVGSCEIDSNMIFRQSIINHPLSNPLPGGAINLAFGRDNAFVHHNIIDDAMVGIRLGGYVGGGETQDNSINNSIFSNDIGAGVQYSWLRIYMSGALPYQGTRIFNNIFRTDAGWQENRSEMLSHIVPTPAGAVISGGAIGYLLTKELDPLFTDPSLQERDYRLSTGSPAIDMGVGYLLPNGLPASYLGGAPDIGAVEFGTYWRAGIKPPEPDQPGHSPVLSMDDLSLWTIPADQPVAISTSNKVEGQGSFSITPTGYKILESSFIGQTDVGGLNFLSFGVFVPSLQSNPWWVGAVQVFLDCPSRGLWNQWVGQVELTNLAKDAWQVGRMPIPAHIATALNGATYSDLKVRIAVNLNPGSGNLLLDDIRFEN